MSITMSCTWLPGDSWLGLGKLEEREALPHDKLTIEVGRTTSDLFRILWA